MSQLVANQPNTARKRVCVCVKKRNMVRGQTNCSHSEGEAREGERIQRDCNKS